MRGEQLMRFLVSTTLAAAIVVPGLVMAAGERPIPPFDTQFLNDRGQIQKGVRCAAPFVNPGRAHKVGISTTTSVSGGETAPLTAVAPLPIPVAFHVVYPKRGAGNVSDSQIHDQVQGLNDAFQGLGFSFQLASIDRTRNTNWFNGCYNAATESTMKQALAIDPATTLNIYTCEPSQGILGYAYYPWSVDESSFLHGVVALYSSLPGGTAVPYDEGDTITHEVGHYLGLRHTFAGGCASPGDEVDDTPAEASPAFGCPLGRDTCGAAGVDPIHNFMDYSDDGCMFEFTGGQGSRMDVVTAEYKPSLGAPPPGCGDDACDDGEQCSCPDDCGQPPIVEDLCDDGGDGDCDGYVDCADPDCSGDPACSSPCSSSGASCESGSQCCSGKCKGKPGRQSCQ